MFKKICFNCGEVSDNSYALCSKCAPKPISKDISCQICGIPTTQFVRICPSCREDSRDFISNYSLFSYRGIPKEILTQFKFKKDLSYSKFYAELIVHYVKSNFEDVIICPVPTSMIKRKVKNGYQLDSIIRELKRNGLNVKYLLKKKYSKTQKKLNKAERRINLVSSFLLTKKVNRDDIVILIDDVFTTGATIDACSKVLKSNTNDIYSLTLYRD